MIQAISPYKQPKNFIKPAQSPIVEKTNAQSSQEKRFSLNSYPSQYSIAFVGHKLLPPQDLLVKNFRDSFLTHLLPLEKEIYQTNWAFETNTTPENEERANNAIKSREAFYNDPSLTQQFDTIKETEVQDTELKRHLESIKRKFQAHKGGELAEIKILARKAKSDVNALTKTIDGVSYTPEQLDKKIYQLAYAGETNPAFTEAMDEMNATKLEKLTGIVKKRNEYAQKQGHNDYFDYVLKEVYNIEPKQFNREIYALSDSASVCFLKFYNSLRSNPFPQDMIQKMDESITDIGGIQPLNDRLFKSMGFSLDKLPIVFDIDERPNKMPHPTCCLIDPTLDPNNDQQVGIKGCFSPDKKGFEYLVHESGHAVYYTLMDSALNYLDKDVPTESLTEGVAFLTESIAYREPQFLEKELNLSPEILEGLAKRKLYSSLSSILGNIASLQVEKEIYKNPDISYEELKEKRQGIYEDLFQMSPWQNNWVIPHYFEHPGYCFNYLKASALEDQLYAALTDKLGPLTENPQTSKCLTECLFKPGGSKTEDDLLKKLSGKPFSFEELIKKLDDKSLALSKKK